MAHDPKALQGVLRTAAPPDLDLAFRPMFGGIMAYADGKPFASLFDGGLALKLFGENRAELLAIPGARPLQYAPDDPPSASYVVVPDEMLSHRESLRGWIVRCTGNLKPGKAHKRKAP
jgi:TfoX/Sxy family transcriptional regulator of competence genes